MAVSSLELLRKTESRAHRAAEGSEITGPLQTGRQGQRAGSVSVWRRRRRCGPSPSIDPVIQTLKWKQASSGGDFRVIEEGVGLLLDNKGRLFGLFHV